MSRSPLVLLALVCIGCLPAGSYQGKLVDAITGEPMPDVRLLAKSDPMSSDMTCQTFEALTAADGSFQLEGLCAETSYRLEPGLKFMILEGVGAIDGGVQATEVVTTNVWRGPGAGVYILDGTKMDKQSTAVDVESKAIYESETEKAYYPAKMPITYSALEPGQYLMISGQRNIDKLHFYPIIESGERTFGTKAEPDKDEPWSYIGIEFSSDTEYERRVVEPDASKVKEIVQDDRHVIYLAHDALPPGNYALWEQDGRRTYALTF
jgi:hypothetical protein